MPTPYNIKIFVGSASFSLKSLNFSNFFLKNAVSKFKKNLLQVKLITIKYKNIYTYLNYVSNDFVGTTFYWSFKIKIYTQNFHHLILLFSYPHCQRTNSQIIFCLYDAFQLIRHISLGYHRSINFQRVPSVLY